MSDQNVLDNYKESLVKKFLVNDSDKATYSTTQKIHQLFEEQVNKSPHAVALVFEDKQMTYQQLNSRANQLAHYIREKYLFKTGNTLPRDTLICLLLDRSFEMIISILAVLKSGAAYVPISPDFPVERINYILEDTDTKFLISQQHLQSKISELRAEDLKAIYADSDVFTSYRTDNLKNIALSDSLAYVIYTSGTTGKPKGVMIEHESLTSTIVSSSSNVYKSNRTERASFYSSYIFDVSIAEMFCPLTLGYELHVISELCRKDTTKLSEYLFENKIAYVFLPPIVLSVLDKAKNYSFKSLMFAGESCNLNTAKYWSSNYSLYNLYAPSESCIYSIYKKVFPTDINIIGKPFNNEKVYVLNEDMSLCDVNQQGELHISGIGLARGYLNLPKLTKEKFIDNPFATEEDLKKGYTKLYKTGDICKWLDDGNIAYIGRSDFQVKIRGFRIELGEIESVIGQLEPIEQVCVTAKEKIKTSTQYLAAYVVFKKGKHLPFDQIKKKIQQKLPDYMMPSAFVELDTFPLTINGKLDRSALPTPQFNDQSQYVAPRNENEKKLCHIWQEILEVDKVGVEDDFFKLGGDSITAIQCAGLLSKTFNKHISSSTIFNNSTISLLSYSISKVKNNLKAIPVINQKYYPLSFAQKRFYFIEQLEQGTNAYHIPMLFTLSSDINILDLEMAIDEIIKQSPILRTAYKQLEDTHLVQWEKSTTPVIEHKKVSNDEQYQKLLSDDINAPFNLTNDYPLRVCIYSNEKDNQRHLLINIHHIAIDGWSLDILSQSLLKHYCHFSFNDKLDLPKKTIEYKDFSVWEKQQFSSENIKRHTDYWCNKLKDFEPLDLSLDKNRPVRFDYKGDDVFFTFEEDLSRKINALSSETGFTTYHILLSGFFILLYKYTQQNDLVIGTPVANREHYDLKNIVGCFINNLVFRMRINDEDTALNILHRVYDDFIDMQPYQSTPFDEVVNKLELEKDMSRHPIFQVMFSVQRFKLNSAQGFDTYFTQESVSAYHKVAKFDLTCLIDDSEKEIKGVINYASSLFYRDRIERMVDHYQVILNQVIDSYQSKKVSSYDVLTAKEYQTIVYDWNKTESDYPKDKTIHQWFEEQVNKSPHAVALVFEDKEMTYQELNKKSNQLAYYIRDSYLNKTGNTLPRDTLICLLIDRSFEMIISILAVLKSGAAYVPISPDFPVERINYILEDTDTKFLISQQHLHSKISELRVEGLKAIYADSDVFTSYKTDNLKNIALFDSLAYVIYTSGTTGKPKGVMQTHINVYRLFLSSQKYFNFNSYDAWVCFHNYIFDFSVWEIWGAFFYRAKLVLPSKSQSLDLEAFRDLCVKEKVTVLNQTPTVFYQLLTLINRNNFIYSLRYIIFGGEKLNLSKITPWWEMSLKNSLKTKLINMYGITETTVHVTFKELKKNIVDNSTVGSSLSDMKVYILNKHKQPLPIGYTGELYIGGFGLAKGYLNLKKLTNEKFITSHFSNNKDEKLYRSGDLAKWLPNGEISYVGRNDSQVKIRGFRVEISEIEQAIISIDGVKSSLVVVSERLVNGLSDYFLVAYFVTESDIQVELSDIKSLLKEKIPSYMIPNHFIKLDYLPVNQNGKVDFKKLPKPYEEVFTEEKHSNKSEKDVCSIIANITGFNNIKIYDDFFNVGGNSMLAISLSQKLSHEFHVKITVADVFRLKSAKEIVRYTKEIKNQNILKSMSNQTDIKENIYFIHPAFSGCEVYQSLTDMLSRHYNCIGVDNYNLLSKNKISSLSILAKYYLSLMNLSGYKNKKIILIGWSLGGLIALELAYHLENKGYNNIYVFLLDTHIPFNEKFSCHAHFNPENGGEDIDVFLQKLLIDLDQSYVRNVLEAKDTELKLGKSNLSGELDLTTVFLFKALNNKGYKIKDNNLSKYAKKYKVVKLKTDHMNMIGDILNKWDYYQQAFISCNVDNLIENRLRLLRLLKKHRTPLFFSFSLIISAMLYITDIIDFISTSLLIFS